MRKCVLLLGVSAAGVGFYLLAYSVKRRWFASDFALTEGGHVLLAVMPVVVVALWVLWRKRLLAVDACVAAGVIIFLSALVFNLIVPSVFDRSVSLYLLNTVYHAPDGLSEADIRNEFNTVYFGANYGIKKRLREQTRMGNIAFDAGGDERYRITKSGRRMMNIVRFAHRLYALDPQIVQPKNSLR